MNDPRPTRTGGGNPSRSSRSRPLLVAFLLASAVAGGSGVADTLKPPAPPRPPAPTLDLLDSAPFRSLDLELAPADVASLRRSPRRYVPATVRIDDLPPTRARVRLKGSTGSFRPVDDKPSWTLDFECGGGLNPTPWGVSRLQLGNAVEDPSLMNEWLGARLFRAGGVPAPRVVHARVRLNGRPLGLHILKEGFSRQFLARHFVRTDGAMYDNDLGPDIGFPMHRCLDGPGGAAQPGLDAVAGTARIGDLVERWQRLGQEVDVPGFVDFLALEVMLGHRDGYGLARNNYRIYQDPGSARLVFLPDGMDQLLGSESLPWNPRMSGTLARALLETPGGRNLYDRRFRELFDAVLQTGTIARQAAALLDAVRPRVSAAEYRLLVEGVRDMQGRVDRRVRALRGQLLEPGPETLSFAREEVRLERWLPLDDPDGNLLTRDDAPGGRPSIGIRAVPGSGASWVARFHVPAPGHYRIETLGLVRDVVPKAGSRHPGGGWRRAGSLRSESGLVGGAGWEPMVMGFHVTDPGSPVELRLELNAASGRFWIDRESVRVRREDDVGGARDLEWIDLCSIDERTRPSR